MYDAYPLQWPTGYNRTPSYKKIDSRFKQSMDGSQRFLRDEISRLGGSELIVSTNLRLRQDGGIYADDLRKLIPDPGVAIYFKYKKKDISMCCDQYNRVWENIYALGKGVEALRGMERWGVSDFLERAFTGFAALPDSSIAVIDIWLILGLNIKPDSKQEVIDAYKTKVKECHPDVPGGSHEKFLQLQYAYEKALSFYN